MKTFTKLLLAASTVAVLAVPVFADGDSADTKALNSRIEALEKRIVQLESRLSFASFMPDFAERFHVMHRAGEAGDWAVASHELSELKRLTALSVAIDSSRGQLMQAMMQPSLDALDESIDEGNPEEFGSALNNAVATCNACHAATGSAFIDITLNAREALSLRHPHKLSERNVPAGHGHGHGHGAESEEAHGHMDESAAHDDTGKPAHTD